MMSLRNIRLRYLAIPIALLALSGVAGACGGDDDDGGDASASSFETGTDEEYAMALCEAQNNLLDGIQNASSEVGADASDDEAADALKEPFSDYRDAARDAKVPDDMKEYQASVVSALNDVVDALNDGDAAAFDEIELPQPEEDVRTRINTASESVEECADFGGEVFGS